MKSISSFYFIAFISVLFCLCSINQINGQEERDREFDLAFYADVMTNASSPAHRISAHTSFQKLLDIRLSRENSFEDSFNDIPWIFEKSDPNGAFKIISWQIERDNKEFDYYTLFQSSDGSVIYFNDEVTSPEARVAYSLERSYAAIFHEIYAFNDYYILSGYRQLDAKNKQKICEVLTLENGKPVLGKGIFVEDENTPSGRGKKRIILDYSAVANVNLNINTDEGIIVFDHIVALPGRSAEEGMLQVPDGSYEAYEYKNGQWIYNEKLYTQVQNTPLNNQRIPEKR